MSIKKKLAMGIATGALAVSMIGGGTYAYFNDTEVNTSKFAAGTLDINVAGSDAHNAIIDIGNIKPGDKITRKFKLNNTGSLDVSEVMLTSKHFVTDANWNNAGDDFGAHINVKIFRNVDKGGTILVRETTLDKLGEIDVVKRGITPTPSGESSGLLAKSSDELTVEFEFVDSKLPNQNHFQGDSLKLEWTFVAKQVIDGVVQPVRQ